MKAFTRVTYIGEDPLSLGVYGNLIPGTEFSMSFRDVQYLEDSNDGWPDYLEKGEESDTKESKVVPGDDVSEEALANAKEHAAKIAAEAKDDAADMVSVAKLNTKKVRARQAKSDAEDAAKTAQQAEKEVSEEEARLVAAQNAQKKRVKNAQHQEALDDKKKETDADADADGDEKDPKKEVPTYSEWSKEELLAELDKREVKYKGPLGGVPKTAEPMIALLEADDAKDVVSAGDPPTDPPPAE